MLFRINIQHICFYSEFNLHLTNINNLQNDRVSLQQVTAVGGAQYIHTSKNAAAAYDDNDHVTGDYFATAESSVGGGRIHDSRRNHKSKLFKPVYVI